jgi:hypothetical protein
MSSVRRYVLTITLAYFKHLSHAILTPHLVFKDQFVGGDAPMLSIMQTLQNPCQMQGYSTLLAVGTLQSLPEGKLHMLRSL